MTSISKLGWVGVANETTPLTPATTPVLYIPTKGTFKNTKKRDYADEDRATRDEQNTVTDVTREASCTLKGAWYNDSFVYPLLSFMGLDTPTGAGPYTHALSLTNVPKSQTLFRSYDNKVYSFAGAMCKKLELDFAAGKVLGATADYISAFGTPMVTPPTPTFTEVNPFATVLASVSLSGVTSTIIESAKITLEQDIQPFFGMSGVLDPSSMDPGKRKASIEFVARFVDTTLFAKFTSSPGVDDSMVFTVGTTPNQLQLTFPIVGYDDMEFDTSKDVITLKVKATPRAGVSPNSLFSASIINSVAAYT